MTYFAEMHCRVCKILLCKNLSWITHTSPINPFRLGQAGQIGAITDFRGMQHANWQKMANISEAWLWWRSKTCINLPTSQGHSPDEDGALRIKPLDQSMGERARWRWREIPLKGTITRIKWWVVIGGTESNSSLTGWCFVVREWKNRLTMSLSPGRNVRRLRNKSHESFNQQTGGQYPDNTGCLQELGATAEISDWALLKIINCRNLSELQHLAITWYISHSDCKCHILGCALMTIWLAAGDDHQADNTADNDKYSVNSFFHGRAKVMTVGWDRQDAIRL